jgi:hypothetical protein
MQRNHPLRAQLEKLFPAWQHISISKLSKLPAGWENDLYAFDLMRSQMDHLQRVADLLLANSGIALPEVAELLHHPNASFYG